VASGWPKINEWQNQRVRYYQPKLDGIGVVVYREAMNYCWILGNRWPAQNYSHAQACLQVQEFCLKLPPDTIVWCELHEPGVPAAKVLTSVGKRSDTLQLSMFSIRRWAGITPPEAEGLEYFNAQRQELLSIGDFQRHEIAPQTSIPLTITHYQPLRQALMHKAKQKNLEGYVLKDAHSSGWYKLKPTNTVDAVVMSYEWSTAHSRQGLIKSFQVGVYYHGKLLPIASVGGFSAEELKMLSAEATRTIGRVMEVTYDCLTTYDSNMEFIPGVSALRFPRFKRWRYDKPSDECVYTQLNTKPPKEESTNLA
jgi:hypothetical protein